MEGEIAYKTLLGSVEEYARKSIKFSLRLSLGMQPSLGMQLKESNFLYSLVTDYIDESLEEINNE